jgi:hypothetical protein
VSDSPNLKDKDKKMTEERFVTSAQLADEMEPANPNLFGSVYCRKELELPKKNQAEADAMLAGGKLFKEYTMNGIATLKNYGVAVNNTRQRQGVDGEYVPKPRKWGQYREGSVVVLDHKGRSYLALRITKNTKTKTVYMDADGNEFAYEEIEHLLGYGDKRSSKAKSDAKNAENQGVSVEESVRERDCAVDTILRLAYDGVVYRVVANADGGTSASDSVDTPVPVTA